jgi:hypothetical protein
MSENEIAALYPKLGVELTDALMRGKRGFDNPKKFAEAKIDDDDFKYFASEMGIDPFGKDNKALLGELRYKVENEIDLEQAAKGKTLSRPEKHTVMKRALTDVDVRQRRLFMGFDVGGTVSRKRAFEVKYPSNVVIPEPLREKIEADFTALGVPYTDSDVFEAYLRLKGNQ